jgi:hypothetical protein
LELSLSVLATSDPPKDGFAVAAAEGNEKVNSPLLELADVLVRLDHVASFIVNADHSIM